MWSRYLRFIDEIAGCAFPGKGAFVLLSAVACCFFAGGVMLAGFVVMCLHYSCHIIHAAEAELHRVPVDDLVERAVFGEVCVYEAKELPANVRFNMFTVWGVEPCYLACALASFILVVGDVVGLSRCVGEVSFVAGLVECLLVCWFGVFEDFLGARDV